MAAKQPDGTASLPVAQEATESGGTSGGAASLPKAQEGILEGQYSEMDINGGEMEEEEEEDLSDFVARFASLRRREERMSVIAAELRRMKEQRGSRAPTFIELAAYVFLREIAAASLEGLPTSLSARSLYD